MRSFGRFTSARPSGELPLVTAQVAAAPRRHLPQHRKHLEDMRRNVAVAAPKRREAGLQIFEDREQRRNLPALRHDAMPDRARSYAALRSSAFPSKATLPLVNR
ncbi:hypothetical protein A9K71_19495 [Mesorhizobium sp. WSM3873]|nr:hypothetical protein A9K71_19495 [Mesorhizobium sp. WSM3873]